jgi:hypothetical protein
VTRCPATFIHHRSHSHFLNSRSCFWSTSNASCHRTGSARNHPKHISYSSFRCCLPSYGRRGSRAVVLHFSAIWWPSGPGFRAMTRIGSGSGMLFLRWDTVRETKPRGYDARNSSSSLTSDVDAIFESEFSSFDRQLGRQREGGSVGPGPCHAFGRFMGLTRVLCGRLFSWISAHRWRAISLLNVSK